jgi:general secretion pathway protein G
MTGSLERLRLSREEQNDGDSGFTLIEILIVIVILGVLSAVVVFAVQDMSKESASSACQSDYKTVESAAEAYRAQEGSYPVDIAHLTIGAADGNGPWLKDAPSSTKYSISIGSPVGDGGYQPGVVVVTVGGTSIPAPSGGTNPGTANASSPSIACAQA